jgi:hypothetical protein
MKLPTVLILATMSCAAAAADREVRIEYDRPPIKSGCSSAPACVAAGRVVTGYTVPVKDIAILLFTREPCPLDIPDKRTLLRAWIRQRTNAFQLGCWRQTANDGWVFIGQTTDLTKTSPIPWAIYPRAMLHDDGSATITEPNYDSNTFEVNYTIGHMSEQQKHEFDHMNDKP